jgi:hypothetical protein
MNLVWTQDEARINQQFCWDNPSCLYIYHHLRWAGHNLPGNIATWQVKLLVPVTWMYIRCMIHSIQTTQITHGACGLDEMPSHTSGTIDLLFILRCFFFARNSLGRVIAFLFCTGENMWNQNRWGYASNCACVTNLIMLSVCCTSSCSLNWTHISANDKPPTPRLNPC